MAGAGAVPAWLCQSCWSSRHGHEVQSPTQPLKSHRSWCPWSGPPFPPHWRLAWGIFLLAVPVPELGAVLVGLTTHGAGHGEPGQGVPRLTLLGGWRGGVGWDPAAHLPSAGSRPYGPVPGTACSRVRRVVHGLRDPSLSSPAPWPEGAEPGGGRGGGCSLTARRAVPCQVAPCHATPR